MSTSIPARLVSLAVVERLSTITGVTVFLRRVGSVPGSGSYVEPPTVSATDQRVRPYVVVYPSALTDAHSRSGALRPGSMWRTQLTCVAGDFEALDPLCDAVATVLDGWRPAFPLPYHNVLNGPVGPEDFAVSGASRVDEDVSPPRFWLPLFYQFVLGGQRT